VESIRIIFIRWLKEAPTPAKSVSFLALLWDESFHGSNHALMEKIPYLYLVVYSPMKVLAFEEFSAKPF
jgi:hypothetical protein